MYSKAKLFGHPIHPMLVGFPVAFYTATLLAYVIHAATGNTFWFQLGVVANLAGVAGAALAAVPGFIDWAFGIPNKHPAKTTGIEHMLLNVAALTFFLIDGLVQYRHFNDAAPASGAAIALAALGLACTLGAGFLGWKLIQHHHVGVDLTLEQEGLDVARARQEQAGKLASRRL